MKRAVSSPRCAADARALPFDSTRWRHVDGSLSFICKEVRPALLESFGSGENFSWTGGGNGG